MPANDERDPLDAWLSQQVRPLPPPPGTFELIRRRARRRKVRKLAVSVAGAAVVAAAIAVAVPGGLILKMSPPQVSISAAAGQTPTPSGASHSINGTGSVSPTQSPSHSPTGTGTSAPPTTEPSGPVPANFQPTSVTWVDTEHAWVIGQAGTPGQCANKTSPYICTSVARTDNAGQTWEGGPAPETTGPNGLKGVSQIRFLDGVSGWAFGPGLWATHDSGHTWQPVQTNGQLVFGLETAGNRAFAVWGSCSPQPKGSVSDDAVYCTSFTLMSTPAGTDDWQPVGAGTTRITTPARGDTYVKILLSGTVLYLYLASPGSVMVYSGPLDGTWTRVGTLPCWGAEGGIALTGTTHLAAICTGKTPTLWRSDDGGQSWMKPAVTWPAAAPVRPANFPSWVITSFTAAPDGTLVLATTSGLYVLPSGSTQWKWTNAAGKSAPAGGFSYVGMTTDQQGVALPANTTLHEIWMTFDGGLTWAPRTPITPGN